MDTDSILLFLLLFLTLLVSMFFTAAETAITEFPNNKLKLFENEKGNKKTLYKLTLSPSGMIALFGFFKAVTVILLYIFFSAVLKSLPVHELIALITAVAVKTVFCDGLPKRAVLSGNSENFALMSASAVKIAVIIFTPLLFIYSVFMRFFSALLGLKKMNDREIITEEEIMMMVDAGNETGSIEESQAEMISNVFEFSDIVVSEVMTHRTGIVGVSSEAGVDEIIQKATGSGFSRLPLYTGNLDHIYGIICVKDLLSLVGKGEISGNYKAENFYRETLFFPESAPCKDVFTKMTERKMQMAVIMDEYGGTAGIVTLEDLIEMIVGNIQDEYDNEKEELIKISDTLFTIDGLASPRDIFGEMGIPAADNEYDTMSAFLIGISGKIPENNEKCEADFAGFRFSSLAVKDTLITRIKAEKIDTE